MALGIERSAIGDIVEDPLALICLPELGGFISENLIKAGRAHIHLTQMKISEIPPRAENLLVKTDTVASLRLDTVLGSAFGLSRSKSLALIKAGRVSLNHEECLQSAKIVAKDMIISVRGLGRAKLLEIGGTSKKGRIFVKVGLY
jgi:RNA-binding protein YlmH